MSTYLGNNLISGGSNVPDNTTITMSSSNKLQVVGAKDKNDGNVLNFWTGTKAEYDAIATKDANTLYNITDDNTADAYEAYTKSEVDTLLNDKTNTDLTNVTNNGYIKMAGAGMPSDKYINLTFGASGSTYNAPANGWFYFLGSWSNSNSYIRLENTSKSYKVQTVGITTSGYWGLMLPIAKGDSCLVSYTTAPANVQFRFIYAQGSESEAS